MKAKYIEHPYMNELQQLYRAACNHIKVESAVDVPGLGWKLGKGRRHQVGAFIAQLPEGQYWLLPYFSINQPSFIRVCGPIDKEHDGYIKMIGLVLHERDMMLGSQEPWDNRPSFYDGISIKTEDVLVPDLVKKPDLGAFKHYWNKVETQETLLQKDREQKAAKAEKLAQSRTRYKV